MVQLLSNPSRTLLITIGIAWIIAIGGIGGYWLGTATNQCAASSHVASSEQSVPPSIIPYTFTPTPLPVETSLQIRDVTYVMPANATLFETCSYPWDYDPPIPSPIHMECLEFEANGTIRKKFHDGYTSSSLLLASNHAATEEQKASISAVLRSSYQELTKRQYIDWLEKPKAPLVGSVISHIKLYSGDLDKRYFVTVYLWGADHSEESRRVEEIFNQLQSFSPPHENNSL